MTRRPRIHLTLPLVCGLLVCGLLLTMPAQGEQKRRLGDWDVHYVLIPTLFLKPDIAAEYRITRGRDRAMLNLSVLNQAGEPVRATVTGTARNLLEQQITLQFREVVQGEAIYYLAEIRHSDRDVLRLSIDILPPDGRPRVLEFQQQMYWEGR